MQMRGALLLSVVYQHSPWIHKQFYPSGLQTTAGQWTMSGQK